MDRCTTRTPGQSLGVGGRPLLCVFGHPFRGRDRSFFDLFVTGESNKIKVLRLKNNQNHKTEKSTMKMIKLLNEQLGIMIIDFKLLMLNHNFRVTCLNISFHKYMSININLFHILFEKKSND